MRGRTRSRLTKVTLSWTQGFAEVESLDASRIADLGLAANFLGLMDVAQRNIGKRGRTDVRLQRQRCPFR